MEIQHLKGILLKFHFSKLFLELGDPFAKIKLKIKINDDEQETKKFSAKKECNLDENLNFKLELLNLKEKIKEFDVKIILLMLKKENKNEIGVLNLSFDEILKERPYAGIFEFENSDPYRGKIEMSLNIDEIKTEEEDEQIKIERKEKVKRAVKQIQPFSSSDEENETEKQKKLKGNPENIDNEIKNHDIGEEKNFEIFLLKEELEKLKNTHQIEQSDIQNKIVLLCNELEQKESLIQNLNEKLESFKNSSENVDTQEKLQFELEQKEKEIEKLIQKINDLQTLSTEKNDTRVENQEKLLEQEKLIEEKEEIIKNLKTELLVKNKLFEENEKSLYEKNEIIKISDQEKIELKKTNEKLGLDNEEKGRKIKNFELQINQINKEGLMNNIENLNKMLDERNKFIANLEKTLEEKNQKIVDINNIYRENNKEMEGFQIKILDKNNEIKGYKLLIEKINEEKEGLLDSIKEKDKNILNLQLQIEEKIRMLENMEVENLNVSYQTLENEKYSKEKDCLLQSLEKEYNDIRSEYEAKKSENESKIIELSNILEQKQQEIIDLKIKVNEQTQYLEIQEKIENSNKDLQSKLTNLNRDINQYKEKTTDLSIENQNLSNSIQALKENLARLENLKNENSELSIKNKELFDKTNNSSEKIIELENYNKQLKKEIQTKEGRLSEFEDLYNKLQGDFVRTKQELADTINLIFDKGSSDIMEELEELLVKNSTLQ